jgi:hypothetical protein
MNVSERVSTQSTKRSFGKTRRARVRVCVCVGVCVRAPPPPPPVHTCTHRSHSYHHTTHSASPNVSQGRPSGQFPRKGAAQKATKLKNRESRHRGYSMFYSVPPRRHPRASQWPRRRTPCEQLQRRPRVAFVHVVCYLPTTPQSVPPRSTAFYP